ncbi:hypothetical protein DSL72_004569 [Monilinia vaccinii-corymbosi]|uniref:Pinin/SDK/MemA protein domain-containing protein n=1 Tax=Monilinia vaccinii-corymbosi TaxID=61207 RepID=A0A8A3P4W2_9HELO|nr:hypothetical protein DSL72_004569 [Monilinia vaccinii-corymbosi]
MTDLSAPMASEAVIPKSAGPNVKSPRMKRRQSSESEEASKRPRFSTEDSPTPPSAQKSSSHIIDTARNESFEKKQPLANSPETSGNFKTERRKSSVQEERKRGQRLFGGLLNTLNQSTSGGQLKKRQEIEARQKERAAQRKAEAEDRKKGKIANLKATRVVEQVKFQEESVSYNPEGKGGGGRDMADFLFIKMRIRHANMLAMAQFLSTETEPKLYYKPWLLSARNESTIKNQIEEAKGLIEEEKSEWARRHPEHRLKAGEKPEAKVMSDMMMGEPHIESSSISNIDATNPTSARVVRSSQVKSEKGNSEEHNGEVVVEAEEDTVIY